MIMDRLRSIVSCSWLAAGALILGASAARPVFPNLADDTNSSNRTIADILANDKSLDAFNSILEVAGLVDLLRDSSSGELTLFVPVVDEFYDLDKFLFKHWIAHLRDIIRLHVARGSISSDQLNNTSLEMLNGEQVQAKVDQDNSSVIRLSSSNTDQAVVLETDIFAANGVVHKIDSVLLPVWYERTVFGLAWVLESVWDDISIGIEMLMRAWQGGLTNFGDAGLTDELTIFYPVDSAWLDEAETLPFYRDPANIEALTELLNGHIVSTVYSSVRAEDGDVLTNLAGSQITVSVFQDKNTTVMVNDAVLDLRRDLLAINGIVHGIDKILFLPELAPTPTEQPIDAPTAGAPTVSTTETLIFQDVTLTLNGVVDRLMNDDVQMFEEVTEAWYHDFFAAREADLRVRNVTTEITMIHQQNLGASLILTYDQSFMYISLGNPLLRNEEYVTAPFLDTDENNSYWWLLVTTIESFFSLDSPIAVPQLPNESSTAEISENENENGRLHSIGAIAGIAIGALLVFLFIAAFAARRWTARKLDMATIAVVAVPAEDMISDVIPTERSTTLRPDIVEVLPPNSMQPEVVEDLSPTCKALPSYKDQVRHATAQKVQRARSL